VRISERLDELYAIGGGPGANRPHPSAAEDDAHDLASSWLADGGLEVEVDRHGNLFGRSGRSADVWVGSHLDSVPQGGRFDGALGVVAAIEAVERVGAGSVVVFRGEEVGCIGSRALVFEGRAGHAGTTPMDGRHDALVAAASRILEIRDAAVAIPGAVATVGQLELEPGGVNVIPARVAISLDLRAPDAERLDALLDAIGYDPGPRTEPVQFAGSARHAFTDAVAARGLPAIELASGAGHDAGILASAGVDAAMLFVRSLNDGVSHSPDELSSDDDVALGVGVLADALDRLTSRRT
jgi:acetylornithine deacetylase/succinyl-diaminopimelate desuccinylase-like protein